MRILSGSRLLVTFSSRTGRTMAGLNHARGLILESNVSIIYK